MGNSNSAPQEEAKNPEVNKSSAAATGEKPKCKACCACQETKKARDAW